MNDNENYSNSNQHSHNNNSSMTTTSNLVCCSNPKKNHHHHSTTTNQNQSTNGSSSSSSGMDVDAGCVHLLQTKRKQLESFATVLNYVIYCNLNLLPPNQVCVFSVFFFFF